MIFRFHDPDNPASLYVWGIQPARRKRRMLALARVFAGPVLLIGWLTFLIGTVPWDRLTGPWFVSALALLLVSVLRPLWQSVDRSLRSGPVRDLHLAGIGSSQLIRAAAAPQLNAAKLLASTYLPAALLGGAFVFWELYLEAETFGDDRVYQFIFLPLICWGTPLFFAFHLVASAYMDAALGILYEGRAKRFLGLLALIASSPAIAFFVSEFYFGNAGGLGWVSLIEWLSWPIRGYIVRLLWLRALRHFDEAG